MTTIVAMKFEQNSDLASKLLATTGWLEELNTWHDNTWGNCCCARCSNTLGQNHLGRILMKVREALRSQEC